MTRAQAIRAQRRAQARQAERERTSAIVAGALTALLALAAFALAGTSDYADRTQGIGASMEPSGAWALPAD